MKHRQHAIEQAHEVFKATKEIGRLPKKGEKYNSWINNKKQTKLGNGNRTVWHHEIEEIAKQYGFPHVFDIDERNLKQKTIDKAHEVFNRAKENGHLPKWESKDGSWINNKKKAKVGKGTSIWYPELDDVAKQYGFPNALTKRKLRVISPYQLRVFKKTLIKKAHEIFQKAKRIGKFTSKDVRWIRAKKRAKLGTGSHIWYPELDEIASQYGFPHAFDIRTIKQRAIDKAHQIFKKAKEIGHLPKQGKDNNWISTKKLAKAGNGKGIWYPELDEIANQYGFQNAFNKKSYKKN